MRDTWNSFFLGVLAFAAIEFFIYVSIDISMDVASGAIATNCKDFGKFRFKEVIYACQEQPK